MAIGLDRRARGRRTCRQLAELTGSVYVANEPRTVAIGHIEDVDSWLQFKVQYERFDLLLRVGFCFYDYAGDPPITAYGFVVTGRGEFKIPRLTECKFLLEVSVMLGSFSSDGRSAGILAAPSRRRSRIKVWRMRFGLRARIEIEHIKPHPDAGTATLDFTIETPWWLPDIHISHTWEFGGEPEIGGGRRDRHAGARRAGAAAGELGPPSTLPCRCRWERATPAAVLARRARAARARPRPGPRSSRRSRRCPSTA